MDLPHWRYSTHFQVYFFRFSIHRLVFCDIHGILFVNGIVEGIVQYAKVASDPHNFVVGMDGGERLVVLGGPICKDGLGYRIQF